ncbi:MAG: hypothetical protein WDO56_20860 [Gammaproteobacteria bacterium]
MDGEPAVNADLAERIFNGDAAAENQLCARFGPGVRQILVRRLRNFTLAEDLTQDVLIVVLKRLRRSAWTTLRGSPASSRRPRAT